MEKISRGLHAMFFFALLVLYLCTAFNLYPKETAIEVFMSSLSFIERFIIASIVTMIIFLLYFFAGKKIREIDE